MYQPSYRRKLEEVKIDHSAISNSGNLLNHQQNEELVSDPFVIDDRQDDKVKKAQSSATAWKIKQDRRQNQTATLLEVDEDDGDTVEATKELHQAERERKQRLRTLLESEKDTKKAKSSVLQIPVNKPRSLELQYKGISINKVEQLKFIEYLLSSGIQENYCDRISNIFSLSVTNKKKTDNLPIKLRGIVATINNKKVGLILADISANDRVARVISLVVLPEYSRARINTKLVDCLEKYLPAINCDRLEFRL